MDELKNIAPLAPDVELENIDPFDISILLGKLEISFNITFHNAELKHVNTFGELCDLIVNKVEESNTSDCTTQQAFYKIRKAIVEVQQYDKDALKTATRLEELFPRKQRRQQIEKFERTLGLKPQILQAKVGVLILFISVFLASFIILFFSWPIGFGGMVLSFMGINISYKLGKKFNVKTVGQLAKKISREHYMKVRRNPSTVDQIEITQKVKTLFKDELGLEENVLTREARFS